jgi:tetratricopeptide (TPR) repeat protein
MWCGLVVWLVASNPLGLRAQETAQATSDARDREARNLFEAGRLAYDDGRFEEALGYFQKAFDLSQRPELLYNVGSAAERLRQDDKALAAYERYLREVPTADNRGNVEARVNILRAALNERQRAGAGQSNPEWIAGDREQPAAVDASSGSSWWVWAVVGGVALAGGITAAVLLSSSDDAQAPLPGRGGVVIATLRGN